MKHTFGITVNFLKFIDQEIITSKHFLFSKATNNLLEKQLKFRSRGQYIKENDSHKSR